MNKLTTELENLKEKYETNDKALKDRDETIKNNNMSKNVLYTYKYKFLI